MYLVDPKYPKHTRYIVYTLFALLLVATLALGGMSILKSISNVARVGEEVAEFSHDLKEELSASGGDERISQTYVEETDPINN